MAFISGWLCQCFELDYDQALEWHQKSLLITEEIGDRAGLAMTYNNIGLVYDSRGEYDRAMEWYDKSLPIFEEIGDRAGLARTFGNIGYLFSDQNDYSNAAPYAVATLNIFSTIGAAENGQAINQVGELVQKLGAEKFIEALEQAPEEIKKYLPEDIEGFFGQLRDQES